MAGRLVFALPGSIEVKTGGTIYDRKVIEAMRRAGWTVEVIEWPANFPFPDEADRAAAGDSLAALPNGALVLIDALAYGALPELAEREGGRLRLAALVHHPLALESGLAAELAASLAASERRALAHARVIVTTSETTAATLRAGLRVPADRITVARPGVEVRSAPPRRPPGPIRLFSLGSLTPRKAHHRLVEALGAMTDLDWRCVIAGSPDRAPQTAAALQRQIDATGLGERIALAGEVSDAEVEALYAAADIFVLPSLYEGYGMACADALAWGLPIVATTGGALPEVVGPRAGVLVEPDDAMALCTALRELVADPGRRMALADGARRLSADLSSWDETAALVTRALGRL